MNLEISSSLIQFTCLSFPLFLFVHHTSVHSKEIKRRPILINFGDDNSDTGSHYGSSGHPNNGLPHGITFFNRASGRLGDGRLIIDFLCQYLKINLLHSFPWEQTANFTSGVNFALSGSTFIPVSSTPRYIPWILPNQIMAFLSFKTYYYLQFVAPPGTKEPIDEVGFWNALYMIDYGQNDILQALNESNLAYEPAVKNLQRVLAHIKRALLDLYNASARSFWIHGTGPQGCSPKELASHPHTNKDLDEIGCYRVFNDVSKEFNRLLRALTVDLQSDLSDATIVFVDVYAIKYKLFSKYRKFGFQRPLMACCGNGGLPNNYNSASTCGEPGYEVCDLVSGSLSWDGVHYMDIAMRLLLQAYSLGNT